MNSCRFWWADYSLLVISSPFCALENGKKRVGKGKNCTLHLLHIPEQLCLGFSPKQPNKKKYNLSASTALSEQQLVQAFSSSAAQTLQDAAALQPTHISPWAVLPAASCSVAIAAQFHSTSLDWKVTILVPHLMNSSLHKDKLKNLLPIKGLLTLIDLILFFHIDMSVFWTTHCFPLPLSQDVPRKAWLCSYSPSNLSDTTLRDP